MPGLHPPMISPSEELAEARGRDATTAELDELHRKHLRAAKIARAERLRRIMALPPKMRRKLLLADAKRCKDDPVYWINNWAWVVAPKEPDPFLRDIPLILYPEQADLVRWLGERVKAGESAVMPKSRELGVTWIVLYLRYWAWRFHGASTLFGSRKEDLVDRRGDMTSLFERLRYIHRRQPPHLRERRVLDKHMIFKNLRSGAELKGEATNLEFARGGREEVIVLDEFNAVPARIAASVVQSLESASRSAWFVFNPKDKAHKAYELYSSLSSHQVRKLDWRKDPYRGSDFRKTKTFPQGRLTDAEFEREYEVSFNAILHGNIWTWQDDVVTYDEERAEWKRVAEHARATWFAPGGWDFGSGTSLLVCLFGLVEWTDNPVNFKIWVDDEIAWRQTGWPTAAADAVGRLHTYQGPKLHFGDPAGTAAESDQLSWESKLRGGGVPLWCLPSEVNQQEPREWGIKHVQWLIDSGRLFVHQRCGQLLESMRHWKRDLKEGIHIDYVSRVYVPPRHDVYSHACMALLYMLAGVLMQVDQQLQEQKAGRRKRTLRGRGSREGWQGLFRELVGGEPEDY